MEETMFIDPQRCIGCRACVAACRECGTHKGYSMIYVDYLDRSETTATMPTVCMLVWNRLAPWSVPQTRSKALKMASFFPP
jgi:Fe-S-cluster-containing dehydrogenase component